MAFNSWMAERRPRPLASRTRRQYLKMIRRAIAIAVDTDKSLIRADARTVRFVLQHIAIGTDSQNGMMSALNAFYDFLRSQKLRADNPMKEIGRPPQPKGHPRPISLEDVCRYLDASWELGIYHRTVASLGLYMGLRCAEIRMMQWTDFFVVDDRMWCDLMRKGAKRARKFVHPEIRRNIGLLRGEHNDAVWLFPSPIAARAGEPVGEKWPYERHLEIVKEAGIRPATLHQLRHTYASMLRRLGGDLGDVQDAMDHSSPETTLIYMDMLPDRSADLIGRIDYRAALDRERNRDDEGGAALPAG